MTTWEPAGSVKKEYVDAYKKSKSKKSNPNTPVELLDESEEDVKDSKKRSKKPKEPAKKKLKKLQKTDDDEEQEDSDISDSQDTTQTTNGDDKQESMNAEESLKDLVARCPSARVHNLRKGDGDSLWAGVHFDDVDGEEQDRSFAMDEGKNHIYVYV